MNYERHTHINGANEFLQKIHEPLEELNKDIEKLEGKKAELQGKIVNPNSHKLEDIEKNKGVTNDLNTIQQALDSAIQKRDNLVNESKEIFEEAKELLRSHKANLTKKHYKTNKKIIEKLYEIRNLYHKMEQDEKEELQKVNAFINDIGVYVERELTGEERARMGNTTLKRELQGIVTDPWSKGYHSLIFTTIPEYLYGVEGLLKPSSNVKASPMKVVPHNKEHYMVCQH